MMKKQKTRYKIDTEYGKEVGSVGPSTKSAHQYYFPLPLTSLSTFLYFRFSILIVYFDVHPPFTSKNDAIFFFFSPRFSFFFCFIARNKFILMDVSGECEDKCKALRQNTKRKSTHISKNRKPKEYEKL